MGKHSKKQKAVRPSNTGIQAGVHEGSNYYNRMVRTSEVVGNYNVAPDQLVTNYDRNTLVNKSRFFVENVSCLKAAVEDIATYSVGEAFLPMFEGQDKDWGDLATKWLTNWANVCDNYGNDLNQNLWLISNAIDRDGDVLVQLTHASDGKYPKINLIPSNAIASEDEVVKTGPFTGYSIVDGVIKSDKGYAIGYTITTSGSAYDTLSTTDALLVFESKYPQRSRGFPSLASSIVDWMTYRDIKDFETEAIKQAAAVALIEKNEVGGVLPGQFQFAMTSSVNTGPQSQPIFYKYYNGGTVRYFGSNDPNAGVEQMKNDRPGDLTQTFLKDHVLRGAFASIGWPLEIGWSMDGLNSANTRAILAKVDRKLLQRQSTLFRVWKRVVTYAVAKAIKLGYLPPNKDWYKWTCTYPKSPSIDLGRDVKSSIELYKIGGTTLSDIYGENGENWQSKVYQKIFERKFLQASCKYDKPTIQQILAEKVDVNVIQQLTPNGNTPTESSSSNLPAQ